jgi:hypothetical protein
MAGKFQRKRHPDRSTTGDYYLIIAIDRSS